MSTYSAGLRLTYQTTGENTTTWGDVANAGVFQLLEDAVRGSNAISTTGGTTTLTTVNGATDEARKAILNVTGALVSNATIVIPNLSKMYLVNNATTGSFTLTVQTAAPGTSAQVDQGSSVMVWCDGANNCATVTGAAPVPLNFTKAADIASASTTSIGSILGNYAQITGTTTINSFGTAPRAGSARWVYFAGALTLTNGANLILPGAANITTAAGDTALLIADTTSIWRCQIYQVAAKSPTALSLISIQSVTTTGAGIWNRPAGCRAILVRGVAGSGAGGGCPLSVGSNWIAGGGGGAGAYGESYLASPGATIAYSVGTAGAGVANGNGGNGVQTTFGSILTLGGGLGGAVGSGGGAGTGGGGGTATTAGAGVTGASGDNGVQSTASQLSFGGRGAGSFFGGGGQGAIALGSATGGSGIAATVKGAGGGGAASVTGVNNFAGGDGVAGMLIILAFG